MAGPLIKLGDLTTHGGAVIEASLQSDTGGIPIARMGDKVACALHGVGTIITGDPTLIIDGKAAARHGDMTSCGATLIATQPFTQDLI